MPEDLSAALPHVRRMVEALQHPGAHLRRLRSRRHHRHAGAAGGEGGLQVLHGHVGQGLRPACHRRAPSSSSRRGAARGSRCWACRRFRARWGIQRPEQVVDVLALMGDASDNIPGVPGIGEKTAMKLIAQYGTLDNLLAHAGELTGRVKQTLETNREQALLSKRLATIICDAPCAVEFDALKVQPPDEEKLKGLLVEFEFNSIGRRLFGEDFKAGRGGGESEESKAQSPKSTPAAPRDPDAQQLVLVSETEGQPRRTSQPGDRESENHCRRAARLSHCQDSSGAARPGSGSVTENGIRPGRAHDRRRSQASPPFGTGIHVCASRRLFRSPPQAGAGLRPLWRCSGRSWRAMPLRKSGTISSLLLAYCNGTESLCAGDSSIPCWPTA